MNIIKKVGKLSKDQFISLLRCIYICGAQDCGKDSIVTGYDLDCKVIMETIKYLEIDLFQDE